MLNVPEIDYSARNRLLYIIEWSGIFHNLLITDAFLQRYPLVGCGAKLFTSGRIIVSAQWFGNILAHQIKPDRKNASGESVTFVSLILSRCRFSEITYSLFSVMFLASHHIKHNISIQHSYMMSFVGN